MLLTHTSILLLFAKLSRQGCKNSNPVLAGRNLDWLDYIPVFFLQKHGFVHGQPGQKCLFCTCGFAGFLPQLRAFQQREFIGKTKHFGFSPSAPSCQQQPNCLTLRAQRTAVPIEGHARILFGEDPNLEDLRSWEKPLQRPPGYGSKP